MKILIIGLGSIGKRHLNILKNMNKKINIIALRSDRNAKKIDGAKNYYNLQNALKEKPDIAFITTPTSLHIKYATKCAKAGCHLFIEKPLSHNQKDIKELINIVKKNNLITLMGCNMRFNPVIKKLKEKIYELDLKNIYSYRINCGSHLPDWRPNRDYKKTYSAKKEMGGGVILDLIHEIDYAYWLFGEIENLKSYSDHISNLKINTEDFAEIILKNKNNIIGNIHLNYYRLNAKRYIEIIAKDLLIEADLLNGKLNINYKNKNVTYDFDFKRNYMYEKQMKYFLNCIKKNKKTFNDIKEGYKILKIALKAKKDD